jgi:molybdopterin-guanine dinucleotide biosynthesis protein A
VVVVANEPAGYEAEGWPVRPDVIPGIGALGGIHTAVAWAVAEGLRGCLVLACDMPFVPPSLFVELADALQPGTVVVPESRGPRGMEPLCAAYAVECLPAIRRAIDRGDRAVVSFFPDVDVRVVDLATVSRLGDPARVFFNVNRPEDRVLAESLLTEGGRDPLMGSERNGRRE